MIAPDTREAATRILTEMAEQVRERRSLPVLELFLMWSEWLDEHQFQKALSYLLSSRTVYRFGDELVFARKRGAGKGEPQ